MNIENVARKIWSGGPGRRSRLHDLKGNRARTYACVVNLPRAIVTGLARLLINYRPPQPWISYSAIQLLARHLGPKSRVLEFGSGMSTIWYAQRAGEVFAVENNAEWFAHIENSLKTKKNVQMAFEGSREGYVNFGRSILGEFDLIIVDGSYRDLCVSRSIDLLREGGIIYLDNCDRLDSDMREAEKICLEFANADGADVRYFTDFAPTQMFAQQGLMVMRPKPTRSAEE